MEHSYEPTLKLAVEKFKGSEKAGFITSQWLYVDGGGSITLPDFPLPIEAD